MDVQKLSDDYQNNDVLTMTDVQHNRESLKEEMQRKENIML